MPATKPQAKLFRGSKEGGTNDEKSNVYIDIYSSYYYFYLNNKVKKWHLTHLNKMPETNMWQALACNVMPLTNKSISQIN